jgi:hypothetical protein
MSLDITMQISACTVKKDVFCSAHCCSEITIESSSDRNRWLYRRASTGNRLKFIFSKWELVNQPWSTVFES